MASRATTKRRIRIQHRFDLNLNKEDEYKLNELIGDLKNNRSFLGVIRDGIRLVIDLRQGRTNVLHELFPWVLEQVNFAEPNNEILLKNQFDELKLLLTRTEVKPYSSSLNLSETTADDNEFELTQRLVGEEYDYMPSWNLPIRFAESTGNYASLTPEMIWYGIRTEFINAEKALKAGQIQPNVIADGVQAGKLDAAKLPKEALSKVTATDEGPKKIAEADIALSAPDVDDLELDF